MAYPAYFAVGTRQLSEEEIQDPSKFHHKNQRDLIYAGLNVNILKTFLSVHKVKALSTRNPKENVYVCRDHLRKYDDAIKWGAKQAGQELSKKYH